MRTWPKQLTADQRVGRWGGGGEEGAVSTIIIERSASATKKERGVCVALRPRRRDGLLGTGGRGLRGRETKTGRMRLRNYHRTDCCGRLKRRRSTAGSLDAGRVKMELQTP